MIRTVSSGRTQIPIRNIWLLMLYASDLFRHLDSSGRTGAEENPDDIPDLIAEILAYEVERRLARNLNRGWQMRRADLTRVRGRVDLLRTETQQLLAKGKVACRFDELSIDTPRNRLVRAALAKLAAIAKRGELAGRCRSLAARLERLGVGVEKPPRTEVSIDTFGRFDANDRPMVAAARLAFELALPNEEPGAYAVTSPSREIGWLRRLFERAIAGFYTVTLSHEGWRVNHGGTIRWPQINPTPGVGAILPLMKTDVVLEHYGLSHRIIIDTKFTSLLVSGQYENESLRSEYIYQIYAYLRSQESSQDPMSVRASGVLLHPSVGEMVDEAVIIQEHAIRFVTVDLAASASQIRRQLLSLITPHPFHAEHSKSPATHPSTGSG